MKTQLVRAKRTSQKTRFTIRMTGPRGDAFYANNILVQPFQLKLSGFEASKLRDRTDGRQCGKV